MRRFSFALALVVAFAFTLGCAGSAAVADDAAASDGADAQSDREHALERVTDDVYRVVIGHYRSLVIVDPAGILVTDPIDREGAEWLRDELATRFDVPVRWVVYSHSHIDHTYGGEVFDAPGVDFVSHELAREDLAWTKAETRLPNLTFADELTLHLEKRDVVLRYHGSNNGRGSVSMQVTPGEVLFVVDWIVLGRMPYRDLPGYDIHGMIRSTKEVLELDFETLVGGHAEVGTRADVERYLAYLEALYAAVRDGMLAGKSLETLQAEIRLDEWSDLAMYEAWLPLNIAGVVRQLNDASYFEMR